MSSVLTSILFFVMIPFASFVIIRLIDENPVKYREKAKSYKRFVEGIVVIWFALIGYILFRAFYATLTM